MNRFLKLFLFCLCFIPIFIDAKPVNYNGAINKANNYLSNFKDYNDYLIYNNMMYDSMIVDGKLVLENNVNFTSGGLLSRDEYIITNIRNNSYLVSGLEYWTLTPYSNRRNYVLSYKLFSKSYDETSDLRVSEFVRNEVKIGGAGTKDNPWYFLDVFSINLFSSDENRGMLSLTDCSNINEGQKSIFVYKYGNHVAPFYICEHKDFRYYDSTCSNYFDREAGSNKFEISGKIKDNTICRLDFAYKTYKITLDKCSGCSSPSPSVFYLAVNHDNYFKDEFGKTILNKIDSLPIKIGYTFDGYYRSNEYSSVNKIIDNNGYFVSKDLNDDSILYPYMKANTYTVLFDSNGGSAVASMSVVFDSTYGSLPSPSKTGYTFAGWYTDSGEVINASSKVTIPENHTLKARWNANKYTVTFNSNNGSTPNPSSKQVTYNEMYGSLPTSTLEKFRLDGWYTQLEGGDKIEENTIVKITNNQTLYARWRPASTLPSFKYTGKFQVVKDNDTAISQVLNNTSFTGSDYDYLGNWKVRFLSTGDLTVYDLGNATSGSDFFIVGGGMNGKNGFKGYDCQGAYGGGTCYGGGAGGAGGKCITTKSLTLACNKEYKVIVGTAQKESSITVNSAKYIAAAGGGAAGGYGWYGPNDGGSGATGCKEFGTGKYYAGGGGGAGGSYSYPGRTGYGGSGGANGGGQGGFSEVDICGGAGYDAKPNTGGGGGGGGSSPCGNTSGGKGGSGIVIWRNSR